MIIIGSKWKCKSELHSNHNKTIDFFSIKIFANSTWFTNENNYCLCLPANLLIYWCVDVLSVPVQNRNWFFFTIYIKKTFFATTGRIQIRLYNMAVDNFAQKLLPIIFPLSRQFYFSFDFGKCLLLSSKKNSAPI